jgi:hypothetical protein
LSIGKIRTIAKVGSHIEACSIGWAARRQGFRVRRRRGDRIGRRGCFSNIDESMIGGDKIAKATGQMLLTRGISTGKRKQLREHWSGRRRNRRNGRSRKGDRSNGRKDRRFRSDRRNRSNGGSDWRERKPGLFGFRRKIKKGRCSGGSWNRGTSNGRRGEGFGKKDIPFFPQCALMKARSQGIKQVFAEFDVAGNINFILCRVKTAISLGLGVVANEHSRNRLCIKFVLFVDQKHWASTPKDLEMLEVGYLTGKPLERGFP